MITGNKIRSSFIDHFTKQGHARVRSSSLVPEKDPTLLFTNAGMVQFKNVFLGLEKFPNARAVSSQKCLRISGKHNDLEAVGQDTYHHTFFEMLGNWSFGDYYKEEAILWAWELLTKEWGLPKEHLWATVFRDDNEAEQLWLKLNAIPANHILRYGEKENFWEMGDTGPCGPCSEIHIDRGPEACDRKSERKHRCQVNGDCARFLELWNLVFIQHNRTEDGKLEDLPAKHVDTGMGLERIAALLQGVTSNYDADLLRELITATEELAGKYYGNNSDADISFRVIADHGRAVSFLIADGVLPGNDGRGYVLRRLVRRAARHGRMLGLKDPFLHLMAEPVSKLMGEAYPEICSEQMRIRDVILAEEERFAETLDKGLVHLEVALKDLPHKKEKVLSGEVAFRLYDTFGFPIDLTEDILRSRQITVDHLGFEKLMKEQRTRAREAREVVRSYAKIQIDKETRFIGYDRLECESQIVALYAKGKEQKELREGDEVDIITAETPFYGESGGQVGDRGVIESTRGDLMEVVDTQHITPQITVHKGCIKHGMFQLNDQINLRVEKKHRQSATLNHSATHILHAVLRENLGTNIRQAGSLVTSNKLRFDFTYMGAVSDKKLIQIENHANELVRSNANVYIEEMDYDEAIQNGALALFGEKYNNRVRVVRMGDFSIELCGGTHINFTGEIGLFKLQSEGGVSAGVRRIDAVTGGEALDLIGRYEQKLKEIGNLVRGNIDDSAEKVKKLVEQQRNLEREIDRLHASHGKNQTQELLLKKQNFGGIDVIIEKIEHMEPRQLRELVDQLNQKIGTGVVFLISSGEKNVTLVTSISGNLTKQFHAGNIVKQVAPIVGGGGGGRADFAQAGGKDPTKVNQVLKEVKEILKNPSRL